MSRKMISLVLAVVLISCLGLSASAGPVKPRPHQDYSGKVDIGDFSLYMKILGSAHHSKNEPTIVFDSGYGDDHTVWSDIQSALSTATRTVSYDRAGLGQSDNSNVAKDAVHQAEQLHDLLKKSHVKGPYIFVVHSIGGINARVYASKFGDQLDGIVFIDSSHELQEEQVIMPYLPIELHDLYIGQFTAEGSYTTLLQSYQQAADTRDHDALRYTPIHVLSATDHGIPPAEPAWLSLQADIASLSNYSTHTIVQGSDHYIHQSHPQAVIDAIEVLLQ
jgi:pimeloyl-ACP methyl ester carboxylesterase